MSDEPINGTHLPNADATELHEPIPVLRLGVASVPIELQPGQEAFEVKLRAPGAIRGCMFWYRQPKVLASAMRDVKPVPGPMLLVESHIDAELQLRHFMFIATNRVMNMKEGYTAVWRATAIAHDGSGAGHLFEILEAAS